VSAEQLSLAGHLRAVIESPTTLGALNRWGCGILDENLNSVVDAGESKVYFEFCDDSTSYVFYENPR